MKKILYMTGIITIMSLGVTGCGSGSETANSQDTAVTNENAQVEGERPEGVDGERPEGVDGERPEGVDGERPEGVDGERPEGVEGERSEGVEGERPEGAEGERPEGAEGGRNMGADGEMVARSEQVTTVGKIQEIYGNEIILQVGEMSEEFASATAGGGMGQSGASEEMMAERQSGGGGGMTQGGASEEMMAERQSGGGGGMTQGGTSEEMMAQREEMMAQRQAGGDGATGRTGGGGGGQMGGASTMMSDVDFSEMLTLTDEILELIVPVSTPVTQMGVDMTFSQLTKDTYISIVSNTEGTILRINVLS